MRASLACSTFACSARSLRFSAASTLRTMTWRDCGSRSGRLRPRASRDRPLREQRRWRCRCRRERFVLLRTIARRTRASALRRASMSGISGRRFRSSTERTVSGEHVDAVEEERDVIEFGARLLAHQEDLVGDEIQIGHDDRIEWTARTAGAGPVNARRQRQDPDSRADAGCRRSASVRPRSAERAGNNWPFQTACRFAAAVRTRRRHRRPGQRAGKHQRQILKACGLHARRVERVHVSAARTDKHDLLRKIEIRMRAVGIPDDARRIPGDADRTDRAR